MFNKLTFKTTIVISIIIGLIFTINAYIRKHDIIKNQEKKLNIFEKIKLYAIRMTHYSISFYARFFPLLTKISLLNDIIYIIFYIILYIHWNIFSECILSIKEKQILDPNYVAGSNRTYEPFFILIHDSKMFYDIVQYIAFIALFIVVIRILYNYNSNHSII
jgi:hypothetical protein